MLSCPLFRVACRSTSKLQLYEQWPAQTQFSCKWENTRNTMASYPETNVYTIDYCIQTRQDSYKYHLPDSQRSRVMTAGTASWKWVRKPEESNWNWPFSPCWIKKGNHRHLQMWNFPLCLCWIAGSCNMVSWREKVSPRKNRGEDPQWGRISIGSFQFFESERHHSKISWNLNTGIQGWSWFALDMGSSSPRLSKLMVAIWHEGTVNKHAYPSFGVETRHNLWVMYAFKWHQYREANMSTHGLFVHNVGCLNHVYSMCVMSPGDTSLQRRTLG